MNELSQFRQATGAFYASKDRLPGDLNNLGVIGVSAGQTYTTSSFPAPYNTSPAPNVYSAPFVDLYLEKVIDFKPDPDNINVNGKGIPYSKIYKKSYYIFVNYNSGNSTFLDGIKINSPYIYFSVASSDRPNTASDFKVVDQKMDDGFYNSGSIRAVCYTKEKGYSASYDEVINEKGNTEQCEYLLYHMGV